TDRGRVMRGRVAWQRRSGFAQRFVQKLPAFAAHAAGFVDRAAQVVELARDLFNRRLDLPPPCPSELREKQIARHRPDDPSQDRRRYRTRVVLHASLLPYPVRVLQVVCHVTRAAVLFDTRYFCDAPSSTSGFTTVAVSACQPFS